MTAELFPLYERAPVSQVNVQFPDLFLKVFCSNHIIKCCNKLVTKRTMVTKAGC